MAPKAKISCEMIIDAAYDIIRLEGIEKLTVRSIAKNLHCSTQPILYHFHGISEIRNAAYEKADRYHTEYIMPKGSKRINPLLELGLNYVRFGYEEKLLFRFLFQSNRFSGLKLNDLTENGELAAIIAMVARGMQVDTETAKTLFLSLFITAHGCASLLAGNNMEYEEERITQLLRNSFQNLTKRSETSNEKTV